MTTADETHEIVPDGVDAATLSRRRAAKSSTDEDDRTRCPECGSLCVRLVGLGSCHKNETTHGRQCEDCGARWGGVERATTAIVRFDG